ncbi:Pentatricopeptide repeat-containing protein [Acorus gramineus]|uniref:Pentatricopeptide repeat-containing protein n=1 Tax=Acorus gramineus TaxID=55184 RepID=A0AAV9AWW9_ACOGR|nr:Pentatricopeptide repeat-containing protein [Acorus gramineus]
MDLIEEVLRSSSITTVRQLDPYLTLLIVTGLALRFPHHSLHFPINLLSRSPSSLHRCRHLSLSFFGPHIPLWNHLIRRFSSSPSPSSSLHAFIDMLRLPRPPSPDHMTFPFLAKASSSFKEGTQIHSQVIRRGFASDVFVFNNLLHMYAKSGSLDLSRTAFESMPERHRNEVSWTTIISAHASRGELELARSMFDRMPERVRVGCPAVWNAMISAFAAHGLVSVARKWFDRMPGRNAASWNAMISGYVRAGDMSAARGLFDRMPEDERDVVSWSAVISGYVSLNRCGDALELFKAMQVKPNEATLAVVLSACARLAALEQGRRVHAYAERNGLRLERDNLGAALVDMYAKCGSIESASELFWRRHDELKHSTSAWNALITGLAVNGRARESLEVYERMRRSVTARPDGVTFLGALTACVHCGLVDEGRACFESMSREYGIRAELKHYGCVVDLLGRAGLLEEAEGVVQSMPMKPDMVVLSALLGACRIHRDVSMADRLRTRVLELDPHQADVCFLQLASIYASAGRWSDARALRSVLERQSSKKQPGFSLVESGGVSCQMTV